jgi:predicted membrane channel-forming protein YqfA (hemolysin III family)
MWRIKLAKSIRLATLTFILLVCAGIVSQKHLLSGVSTADIALALASIMIPMSPIFITMGFLLRDNEPEHSA